MSDKTEKPETIRAGFGILAASFGKALAAPITRANEREEAIVRLIGVADTEMLHALADLVIVGLRPDEVRMLATVYAATRSLRPGDI